MNLIKINGEKEWDKSQYEYSRCLCKRSTQLLPAFKTSNSKARRSLPALHCLQQQQLFGALQLHFGGCFLPPLLALCQGGRWLEAARKMLPQSLLASAVLGKQHVAWAAPQAGTAAARAGRASPPSPASTAPMQSGYQPLPDRPQLHRGGTLTRHFSFCSGFGIFQG